MIDLVLAAIAMAAFDRLFPLNVWRFVAHSSPFSERQFLERYGLYSFPRTVLGVLVCVAFGLRVVLPAFAFTFEVSALVLIVLYAIAAGIDCFKAAKVR